MTAENRKGSEIEPGVKSMAFGLSGAAVSAAAFVGSEVAKNYLPKITLKNTADGYIFTVENTEDYAEKLAMALSDQGLLQDEHFMDCARSLLWNEQNLSGNLPQECVPTDNRSHEIPLHNLPIVETQVISGVLFVVSGLIYLRGLFPEEKSKYPKEISLESKSQQVINSGVDVERHYQVWGGADIEPQTPEPTPPAKVNPTEKSLSRNGNGFVTMLQDPPRIDFSKN